MTDAIIGPHAEKGYFQLRLRIGKNIWIKFIDVMYTGMKGMATLNCDAD